MAQIKELTEIDFLYLKESVYELERALTPEPKGNTIFPLLKGKTLREEDTVELGDVLRCVEEINNKAWKKGELFRIAKTHSNRYEGKSNLGDSNSRNGMWFLLYKDCNQFEKVDINILTLEELIKLGYEIKVVKK